MLPDFPEEKLKLMKVWTKYLGQKQSALLGPFAAGQYFTHHEGDRWRIERSDGSVSESEYHEFRGEFLVSNDEAIHLTAEQIIGKLDVIAEGMASEVSRTIFETIKEAADEAGNSIANGQPLTKETFLELISRIEIDFDQDGKPKMPTLFVPPGFDKSLLDEWNNDPELTIKHEELMRKKKEEWDAREACRKLVD